MNNYSSTIYVSVISITAAIGGFLFGFDTAVISGALSSLIQFFHLEGSPSLQGWLVSSIILGSVVGAAGSGWLADRFGRKAALGIGAILFVISAAASAFASSFTIFILSRLLGGLAVGIAAMVAPLFISEISPPHIRGRLVSMYQFAVTLGVLVAYFSNNLLRQTQEYLSDLFSVPTTEIWRLMLGSELIPSVLFLALLFFVPESPRFLVMLNKKEKAGNILEKISGPVIAQKEMKEITLALASEGGSVSEMFAPGLRKASFIAIFLAIVSQFSGIDIVLHYGPLILERAGFSFGDSLHGQIIFGVVLVVFTMLAMWKVDALGRRKLLFIGNAGIFISLLAIGWFFYYSSSSQGLIIAISVFIASFAFSLGPIPWIIMAEIFPTRIRGRAMAVATLALFGANWLIAQLFPYLAATIGEHGTFGLLAVLTLPTFWFVWKVLPETKGRTLEELESSWAEETTSLIK